MDSGDIEKTAVLDLSLDLNLSHSNVGEDNTVLKGTELNSERDHDEIEIVFDSCNLEEFDLIDEVEDVTENSFLREIRPISESDVTSTTRENEGTSKLFDDSLKSISPEAKYQLKDSPTPITLVTANESNNPIPQELESKVTKVNELNLLPKKVKCNINRANEWPNITTTEPLRKIESRKGSVFTRISYSPLSINAKQPTLEKTFGRDDIDKLIRHMNNSQDIKNDCKIQCSSSKEGCLPTHTLPDGSKDILYEKQVKVTYESDVNVNLLHMEENAVLEFHRLQLFEKSKLFYTNECLNILKLHKNRRQNKIVIVTDERSQLDLSIFKQFGKEISIVVIPGLKLSRCYTAVKQLPSFGKGTTFVFVCGTHDLLLSVPSQRCLSCEDCKEALNLFKLSSYCGDPQLLIKKVLQLNIDILNSTKNDIAIFCGLFPVNINQENDIRYQNRKCKTRHDVEQLQFVEAIQYEKYYNSIHCFNKFVNELTEKLGYNLWNFDNFKLFEQMRYKYQFVEGLYTVSSFEQEKVEKEIKIKCKELLKSLMSPVIPKILKIMKDGTADGIVKLTGNVEADLIEIVSSLLKNIYLFI